MPIVTNALNHMINNIARNVVGTTLDYLGVALFDLEPNDTINLNTTLPANMVTTMEQATFATASSGIRTLNSDVVVEGRVSDTANYMGLYAVEVVGTPRNAFLLAYVDINPLVISHSPASLVTIDAEDTAIGLANP